MSTIYVIDIETTGLDGCPKDKVLEIGVCTYDTASKEVAASYDTLVGYRLDEMTPEQRNCWAYQNTTLRLEDTLNAPSVEEVREKVHSTLSGHLVTSYNREFDIGHFLSKEPWNLDTEPVPCVMMAFGQAHPELCSYNHHAQCCSLEIAYHSACPDNPVRLSKQTHRALDDALMAAYVLKHLDQCHDVDLG